MCYLNSFYGHFAAQIISEVVEYENIFTFVVFPNYISMY